jgi:hypothetical protein
LSLNTEENLVAIEGQGIRAYIPQADMDHRTAFFAVERFSYDPDRDVYVCPAGKDMRFDRPHSTERQLRYRARAADCNHCSLKAQCTASKQGRTLCRSVDEDCLERVRSYAAGEAYHKALRKRQVWVEPLFGEGKQWHGLRRFRLRRLWRVNIEALLIGAGLNLKRLLKAWGWGRRPCPSGATMAVTQPVSPVFPCRRISLVYHVRHRLGRAGTESKLPVPTTLRRFQTPFSTRSKIVRRQGAFNTPATRSQRHGA